MSNNLQGVMFDTTGSLLTAVNNLGNVGSGSGGSSAMNGSMYGQMNNTAIIANDLRLEWQSAPLQCVCILPYIISLEGSQLEIHNAMTLSVVQTIKISAILGKQRKCNTIYHK